MKCEIESEEFSTRQLYFWPTNSSIRSDYVSSTAVLFTRTFLVAICSLCFRVVTSVGSFVASVCSWLSKNVSFNRPMVTVSYFTSIYKVIIYPFILKTSKGIFILDVESTLRWLFTWYNKMLLVLPNCFIVY